MRSDPAQLPVRSWGFWLAALGAMLMLVNTVRAVATPVAFAAYLGLPLADPADAALLSTYALRALFIALLIGALLMLRDRRALAIVAAVAVVMPIGDAALAINAHASAAIVGRHVAIAVFLVVTALVLRPRAAP